MKTAVKNFSSRPSGSISWAIQFLFFAGIFATVGLSARAATNTDWPLKNFDRLLISVPEATLRINGEAGAKTLRVSLQESAAEDFEVQLNGARLEIHPKAEIDKESFGQVSAKKRVIEITGAPVALEVHIFSGQVQLSDWSKDSLIHVQKGKVLARNGSAALVAHVQNGELMVLDHQGKLNADTYKATVQIKSLTGDADIESFLGDTQIDRAKGFLSLKQGQGSSKIVNSSGTLQFELTKGVLNSQGFNGRVEGQTQEGPVNITVDGDSDVNVKSQSGRVTIRPSSKSGAWLNVTSAEGDIYGPSYMRVSREGSQKSLRGRLRGDVQKGSIVVRSQDGVIVIR